MNEIANLCERVGADVEMVRKGVGSDPRIGPQFLFAGVGYGGSCFPKDVSALVKTSEEFNYNFKILNSVIEVNKNQKLFFAKKIISYFKKDLKRKKIAIWGLSFKPNTDDMREAPSVTIVKELLKHGAAIHAYDPVAMREAKKYFGNLIKYGKSDYGVLKDADALIVITEWHEFRRPDLDRMKKIMKGRVIFDGRNIYDPSEMRAKGFKYFGVGRR